MSKIFVDGFLIQSNPSDVGGITTCSKECKSFIFKGEKITNNQTEIGAIIFGLLEAKSGDTIISDSQLAVNLIIKNWKTDKKDLAMLAEIAKRTKKKSVKLKWERREKNKAGIFNDKNYKQAGSYPHLTNKSKRLK